MSDDWDSKTVIGSRTRGGGSHNRETVIRGQSGLNAARRTGAAIETNRKFATGNQKGPSDGQRMTHLDRSDDIVKKAQIPKEVKEWLSKARNAAKDQDGKPMSQQRLAQLCRTTPQVIAHIEGSKTDLPETTQKFNEIMTAAENALKIHLRGKSAGEPKLNKREREELERKQAEEKKKAKEEAKRVKEEEEEAAKVKREEEEARAKEEEEASAKEEEARAKEEATTAAMAKARLQDDDDEDEE